MRRSPSCSSRNTSSPHSLGDDDLDSLSSPSNSGISEVEGKMASPESRESFRHEVNSKRTSLTPQELGFLTSLVRDGSEQEISLAKSKLANQDLFFHPPQGGEYEHDEHGNGIPLMVQPTTLTSVGSEGSARRQGLLDERRNSSMHGQIWKAHQNGLAVSQKSSRQSFLKRERSWNANRFNKSSVAADAATAGQHRKSLLNAKELWEIQHRMGRYLPTRFSLYGDTEFDSNIYDGDDELSKSLPNINNGGFPNRRRRQRASIGPTMLERTCPSTAGVAAIATADETPPFLPSLARAMTADGVLTTVLRNQMFPPRQPYQPTLRRMDCVSGHIQYSVGPALKRNGSGTVSGPVLRRTTNSTINGPPEGQPLRRKSISAETATPPPRPPPPPGPPVRHRSSGGVTAQIRRYSRSRTLRQRSSGSLMGIPEESKERQQQQENTEKDAQQQNQHDNPVKAAWEGTCLPEEIEDKKMSDDEMVREDASLLPPRWHQRVLLRRASVNDYGGEGMEIAAFVDDVDSNEMGEDNNDTEHADDEEEHTTTEYAQHQDTETSDDQFVDHAAIMRRASINVYQGEGMEISDWDAQEELEERRETIDTYKHHTFQHQSVVEDCTAAIQASASFDETKSLCRQVDEIVLAKGIPRSFSEDELSSLLAAQRRNRKRNETRSDDMDSTDDTTTTQGESYDTFEYDTLPFRILGTNAEDIDSQPHVLSPPLMESLQSFFPISKTSDNLWMKYSLVRDGASFHKFLQYARAAHFSILALETVDGEVMGAFTTEPWHKTWSYFGGGESFVWKLRHSRKTKCNSIIDQAHLESEVDVYPFANENNCVQICRNDIIAVGGGSPRHPVIPESANPQTTFQDHEWGHALALEDDLLHGSSSPCITFKSPSLSEAHSDGSLFEIINLELWTLTPCYNVEDAEKLELGKLFLEEHVISNSNDYDGGSLDGLSSY